MSKVIFIGHYGCRMRKVFWLYDRMQRMGRGMGRHRDGWTQGWMDGCMDRCMNSWIDG